MDVHGARSSQRPCLLLSAPATTPNGSECRLCPTAMGKRVLGLSPPRLRRQFQWAAGRRSTRRIGTSHRGRRSSSGMHSLAGVELPNLSEYINWQRPTPTHRYGSHLKSRIHDLHLPQPFVLSQEALIYLQPFRPFILAFPLITDFCNKSHMSRRRWTKSPAQPPLALHFEQSALLFNTTTSSTYYYLEIHFTERVHISL